ncbi:hypothetical protein KPL70_026939 [Citrus sinensis]|uniref:DUF4408 domain-containing protein n=2 Tax=Citrus TaxID=2706 RepID=A0A067F414_CITSI|nr:hypothetical protein CICLE_v10009585mg [Citrus x clementina]KAH9652000.1 hypothetical protein KPL70_026939 [Citrus sinensis]KDO62098.1 hypothetical protein CISIN_1g029471mg [Citrus sinensis]
MNSGVFKKSQILMLSLLASLLIITPLLSSSLRPTYLYFVFNILIIALGAEAGLLSSGPSKPPEDHKNAQGASTDDEATKAGASPPNSEIKKVKAVEKSVSEKISGAVKVNKLKKCPSTPSLFFIGSGETETADDHQVFGDGLYEEKEEEEVGGLSGQELFTKAEMFIGNFYKQLKMQREDSWKRIDGFYQKAF